MRLAVSNIAWDASSDSEVARILTAAGVDAIEVAPTKAFADVAKADLQDARDYRAYWADLGLSVLTTQSLLFGRPDLLLFGDDEQRRAFVRHLEHVLELGAALGARAQVFGSPKNRRREGLPEQQANEIAAEVFSQLARAAERYGTTLCLEANPVDYGADFLTSAHQAAALVEAVDLPGLRLHLDTACMQLAGDDVTTCVEQYAHLLAHVHVSEPQLGPVGVTRSAVHEETVAALRTVGYDAGVSVEMRPVDDQPAAGRTAADYAVRLLAGATA